MQIIDGKKASEFFISALALETESFFQETGIRPHLAAVLVGNSGPSETYVAAKMEACKKAGFNSSLIRFEPSISENELLKEIDILNKRADLHGFIVQLPLPEHISVDRIIEAKRIKKQFDPLDRMEASSEEMPAYLQDVGKTEIPSDAFAEDPERDWSTDRSIEIKGMVPPGEEEQIEELELELED